MIEPVHDESMPLLVPKPLKKPFYRASPLWLVPFVVITWLTMSMTMASRLEVFTQLSCTSLHGYQWNHIQSATSTFASDILNVSLNDPMAPYFHPYTLFSDHGANAADSNDTRNPPIPSACVSDPAVQAGAARLHAIMTTTMGLLSAFTAGWWGSFGERHGRKKVLALPPLGLFLTDLTFTLVSTPSSPLSKYGYNLIIVSSIVEGLLGGHSMPQSVTSAYLSDCTSSGSRAHIFSRFTGIMNIGFSVGPILGGWLIRHPLKWVGGSSIPGRESVTSVFWVAVFFSFINFLLVVFVIPESLDKEKRDRAIIAYQKLKARRKGKTRARASTLSSGDQGISSTDEEEDTIQERNRSNQEERANGLWSRGVEIISRFLSPLAVFLPAIVFDSAGIRRPRRDWSLTLLAVTLFTYMVYVGGIQMKWLYGRHTYGWSTEQLSYYISLMGGSRTIFLLFLLPTFISLFKPKLLPSSNQKGKAKPPISNNLSNDSDANMSTVQQAQRYQSQPDQQSGEKPQLTRAQLGQEIGFDLLLTRLSLMIDVLSQTLIILFPAPSPEVNGLSLMQTTQDQLSFAQRQAIFVVASTLSSMGSGVIPAIHSLALCLLQARGLESNVDGADANRVETRGEGAGGLFGAFAVLQTIGQMILGPMVFGFAYSATVARFPKAIFTLIAAFLTCALTLMFCVTNPVGPAYPEPV